jgi:hypothetical protein
MNVQASDLARLPRERLDDIFRKSQPGTIPVGRTRGTALIAAGTFIDGLLKPLVRAIAWKGKVFRPESEDLKNLLSPIGFQGIRARVYQGTSWFDQKPAIIIDYSRTSLVARMVRDEIRQVAPGLYLGQIFLWKTRVGHFMLETSVTAAAAQPATTSAGRVAPPVSPAPQPAAATPAARSTTQP